MPDFGTFGLEFGINIVIIETSALEFVLLHSLVQKKSLNLGPIVPCLGIFGLELENNIVIFEINALEFVKMCF